MHHKAKVDFAIVEKARDMREFDSMELKEIQGKLAKDGHFVPKDTLIDWIYFRTRCYA